MGRSAYEPEYFQKKMFVGSDKTKYYTVLIFKDKRSMHRFWDNQLRKKYVTGEFLKPSTECGFEAQAVKWNDRNNPKSIGEVMFYSGYIGVGLVAHEFSHAALYHITSKYKLRLDLKPGGDHDEELASTVHILCNQFWVWYYKKEIKIKSMLKKNRHRD